MLLKDILSERENLGGYNYEKLVYQALKQAGISGKIKTHARSAASDAHKPDLDFVVNGHQYLLEVKQGSRAQMGGTSFKYNPRARKAETMFLPVNDIFDPDDLLIIQEIMVSKQPDLNQYLQFIINHPITQQHHFNISGWPFVAARETLDAARDAGLLRNINTTIQYDTSFIHNHYASKGIFYIQIGGSGLFYMAENPAGLPIPQLKGEIDLEVRSGPSGGRELASGVVVAGNSLRIQGRWQYHGKSVYSLDNPNNIAKLLARTGTGTP
jgi:hypothetical protein